MDKTKLLNLREFIDEYYSWYKLDSQAYPIVKRLHHYVIGHPDFEKNVPKEWTFEVGGKSQSRLSFKKGLLIYGNVGTGKTEMLRIVNMYMRYLRSPYEFKTGVVWKFADEYRESGKKCFDRISKFNFFFDELCLTDKDGYPTKEKAQYMGNWVLAGEEIIRLRAEDAMPRGWKTHFTTNEPPVRLSEIYGERAFSRLIQMCNFIPLLGFDRRCTEDPIVHQDFRHETFQAEINQEELDRETKQILDKKLCTYKVMKDPKAFGALDYDTLSSLDIVVAGDIKMNGVFIPNAINLRKAKVEKMFSARNQSKLLQMHADGKFDKDEQREIMTIAKHLAVLNLADSLIEKDKLTFFE